MIRITINTDNAAFHDDDGVLEGAREIARILRRMADEFEGDGTASDPRDYNGHAVGTVKIT